MFVIILTWERADGDGVTNVFGPFRSVADANARANTWAAAAKNAKASWVGEFAYFRAVVRPMNAAQWSLPIPDKPSTSGPA